MAESGAAIQELAQAVSEGVLRAVSARAEFKTYFGKEGLVIRPIITAGGILYFGAAATRFASIAPELPTPERS